MDNKKTLDSSYYRFNPILKQIIFQPHLGLKQEDIFLIVNLTDNQMIYNFTCPNEGGTWLNNILTLTYETSTMSETDKLMIIVNKENKTEYYLEKILDEIKTLNEFLIKEEQ